MGNFQGKKGSKLQIMSEDTVKGTKLFNFTFWGWSYTCFRVYEELYQFGKVASQSPDFYRIAHFHLLNI